MSGNVEHRNKKKANPKEAFPIAHPKTEIRKDGGWSWIVCISAALVQFVVLGIHNSFGILYIVFLKEYGWGKALTGTEISFRSYNVVSIWLVLVQYNHVCYDTKKRNKLICWCIFTCVWYFPLSLRK